jgi:mRNA interferase MazF
MTCRRGDIVSVLSPDSNLRTSKLRPALVVQADQLDSGLPQTIVAMITSNMARAGYPSRLAVRVAGERANGSGLLMDSVIMTDNLATVHYAEIDRVIGTSQTWATSTWRCVQLWLYSWASKAGSFRPVTIASRIRWAVGNWILGVSRSRSTVGYSWSEDGPGIPRQKPGNM